MLFQMQDDCAALQGAVDVLALHQFTEDLKAEFRSILADTLATADCFRNEARLHHAADLCAGRCQEKLLKQIDASKRLLPHAAPETMAEEEQPIATTKVVTSDCSSCPFFDLTSGDVPDDISTSANSSVSDSDMDLSVDSIEFMYEDGLHTINVNKTPDDFVALHQDIRGLQDLRDYTAKDLHSLYEDIQGLQKELKDVRGNLRGLQEEPSSLSKSGYPDSCRTRRYSLVAERRLEAKKWVAAKSPGVCGDIGDHMRSKLRERQERRRSSSQVSGSSKAEVQVYLSNVTRMGGKPR